MSDFVVGAFEKGDARQHGLHFAFEPPEQVGQFQDDNSSGITEIRRVIVNWKPPGDETEDEA